MIHPEAKRRLIILISISILIILAIMYFTYPWQKYAKMTNLIKIDFVLSPPTLTYTFDKPLTNEIGPDQLPVILKNFTPIDMKDGHYEHALQFVEALLHNSGVPFIPTVVSPSIISSHAVPSQVILLDLPELSITGTGEMWFTIAS